MTNADELGRRVLPVTYEETEPNIYRVNMGDVHIGMLSFLPDSANLPDPVWVLDLRESLRYQMDGHVLPRIPMDLEWDCLEDAQFDLILVGNKLLDWAEDIEDPDVRESSLEECHKFLEWLASQMEEGS